MADQENILNKKESADIGTVVDRLNQNLADQTVLYIKLRNYHWNVTGQLFFRIHELTENFYDDMATAIDETAERIRQLDSTPLSTMEECLEHARLNEDPQTDLDAQTICNRIIDDFQQLRSDYVEMVEIAENAGDPATADWATERISWLEKSIWMIKSLIKK
jgi:starvation-inducible DNA-binding protein